MAMHSRAGPVVVVVAAAVVVAGATLRRQVLVERLQGADYRLRAAFRRPVPVGQRTGRQQRPSTLCHITTSLRRHQHDDHNDRYNLLHDLLSSPISHSCVLRLFRYKAA